MLDVQKSDGSRTTNKKQLTRKMYHLFKEAFLRAFFWQYVRYIYREKVCRYILILATTISVSSILNVHFTFRGYGKGVRIVAHGMCFLFVRMFFNLKDIM